MSLSESMLDVGRPVAYYPRLARFFGSVNVSILFSQLFYWDSRTENPLGVFKTAEELEEETGLTYREQATARKHLVERGFLNETHKRLEHRVYYKLNLQVIDAAFGEWTKAQTPNCGKRNPPNDENAFRGQRQAQPVNKTETTTETTTETSCVVPAGYPAEFEAAWMAYPKRSGVNKKESYKAWAARIKQGVDGKRMLDGVIAYAAYCVAMKTDPQYIKQPATFFGPAMHFDSDWGVGKQKQSQHSGFEGRSYANEDF